MVTLLLLAWAAVSVVVGIAVGRAVRARDRQVPRDNDERG